MTRSRRPEPKRSTQPSDPAGRVVYHLDEAHWVAFQKLLKRPAQPMLGLASFLAAPTVLEESTAGADESEESDG